MALDCGRGAASVPLRAATGLCWPGGDIVLPGGTPDPDGPGPPRVPSARAGQARPSRLARLSAVFWLIVFALGLVVRLDGGVLCGRVGVLRGPSGGGGGGGGGGLVQGVGRARGFWPRAFWLVVGCLGALGSGLCVLSPARASRGRSGRGLGPAGPAAAWPRFRPLADQLDHGQRRLVPLARARPR